VIKLLKAGATVVGTTRYPENALRLYESYPEWKTQQWSERLFFFPNSLDLDVDNIVDVSDSLRDFISLTVSPSLDILVVSAAQTIRQREKARRIDDEIRADTKNESDELNRYGDPRYAKKENTVINSWQMKLEDLEQKEMEEVYRVNAVAPFYKVFCKMSNLFSWSTYVEIT
jgi:NAD(P)-dependent dehydrogenase (short-subunit alcohol dehydrogenase family)